MGFNPEARKVLLHAAELMQLHGKCDGWLWAPSGVNVALSDNTVKYGHYTEGWAVCTFGALNVATDILFLDQYCKPTKDMLAEDQVRMSLRTEATQLLGRYLDSIGATVELTEYLYPPWERPRQGEASLYIAKWSDQNDQETVVKALYAAAEFYPE